MSWNHVGHHLSPGRVANNGNYIGDLVIIDCYLNLHPFAAVKQASKQALGAELSTTMCVRGIKGRFWGAVLFYSQSDCQTHGIYNKPIHCPTVDESTAAISNIS